MKTGPTETRRDLPIPAPVVVTYPNGDEERGLAVYEVFYAGLRTQVGIYVPGELTVEGDMRIDEYPARLVSRVK